MSKSSKTGSAISKHMPNIVAAAILAYVIFMIFDSKKKITTKVASAVSDIVSSLPSSSAILDVVSGPPGSDINAGEVMPPDEPFRRSERFTMNDKKMDPEEDEEDGLAGLGFGSAEKFTEPAAAPVSCPPGGRGIHKVYMGKPLLATDPEEGCWLGEDSMGSKCAPDRDVKQAPFFNPEFTTSVIQAIDDDPSRKIGFTPPQATTQNFDLRATPSIPFQGKPPSSSYVNAVKHQGLKV